MSGGGRGQPGKCLRHERSGVYRYGAKDGGEPTPWPEQSEYTKSQNLGHVLGMRTNDPELGKKPGFGEQFSGFAIDDRDNIYLGRPRPDPCIQVFDNNGKFLRSLTLPEGRRPAKIRWLGSGILAVTAIGSNPEGVVFLIDVSTGEVKKRIRRQQSDLALGGNGWFIHHRPRRQPSSDAIRGQAIPCHSILPWSMPGTMRSVLRRMNSAFPKHAPGYPANAKGYAIAADGSFSISEGLESNDALAKTELLSYSKEGDYEPKTIQASLGLRSAGNVFLDDAPAAFDLFRNKSSPKTSSRSP